MSYNEKLNATGKGYRYAWSSRSPHLSLHPPGQELGPNRTYASDEQIGEWIDRCVAKGDGTRAELEARLAARVADVASGHEDRWNK
jgi:hypothetical protein